MPRQPRTRQVSLGEPTARPGPDPGTLAVSTGYLPTLDGWRAVAILLVLLNHEGPRWFGPGQPLQNAVMAKLTSDGLLGVHIFFGLSGLLICTRLIAEWKQTGAISLRSFYIRRFFRIIPPYWAYLLVVGVLAWSGVLRVGLRTFLACLVFVRNYVDDPGGLGVYTDHFWSLSVEEHFYAIWPALMVALGSVALARRTAFGLALGVTVWRAVDSRFHITTRLTGRPPEMDFNWRTDYISDVLFLGAWVALLMSDPAWRPRLTRWLAPACWWPLFAAFVAIAFGGVPVPVGRFWIALLIPVLLAGTTLHPRSIAGRFLELWPMRWLGRISYSLYLWQMLFLMDQGGTRPLGWLQGFPQRLACSLACAVVSYYGLEKPSMALGRRLAARWTARPVEPPRVEEATSERDAVDQGDGAFEPAGRST